MNHFDELDALRYLDGELSPSRRHDMDAHVAECHTCRSLVADLKAETELLKESLTEPDEMLEVRPASVGGESFTPVSLAVAGLSGVGLYVLWSWYIVPWWQRLQIVGLDFDTLIAVLLLKGALWEGWSTMRENLVKGSTMLVSIVATVSILLWSWRRFRPLASLVLAVIGLLSVPSRGQAAVIQVDIETYVLPKDEVIANDLIVLADTVRIDGTVDGDLLVCAETLTVSGHVTGDVLALGQNLNVHGQVDGNIRTGSEFLTIGGLVARNVTAAAETVELAPEGSIHGSATLAAKSITLGGRTGRDLMAAAERITLNGSMGGGVLAAGDKMVVGPSAEIQGRVKFCGSEPPEVASGARLAGPIEVETAAEEPPSYAKAETYTRALLKWAAAFVFGLAASLLLPGPYRKAIESVPRAGMSILIGLVTLVAVPVVSIGACLTLIGIPVGVTALVFYAMALYGGQVPIGSWLGKEILGEAVTQRQTVARLALGLLIIHAAGHVPYAGAIFSWVVVLWGLGVIVLSVLQRRSPTRLDGAAAIVQP